jgi:hypothetical protein
VGHREASEIGSLLQSHIKLMEVAELERPLETEQQLLP